MLTLVVSAQTTTNTFRPEPLSHPPGNFSNAFTRPLRFWPVNGDFVITNGAEFLTVRFTA